MVAIRVVFLSDSANPHSKILLEHLLLNGFEVVAVVTSSRMMNQRNLLKGVHTIIKRSGLRYLFMRINEGLHYRFGRVKNINDMIKEFGLREHKTMDINCEETLAFIREQKPDIIISCIFNQILKKEILNLPKYGCINVHRAKLPEHRGLSATFLVLADGDKETGVTVHKMAEAIDAGTILAQRTVPISKEDTIFSLSQKMIHGIKGDLIEVLERIENGEVWGVPISENEPYHSHPTKEDVKNFLKNKRRLI